MKVRKTMENQPLIQEVISQISQRFTPMISRSVTFFFWYVTDIAHIAAQTQAIDTLLEKEYIERVDGTRDSFAYVAQMPLVASCSFPVYFGYGYVL
jgi:cullin 1